MKEKSRFETKERRNREDQEWCEFLEREFEEGETTKEEVGKEQINQKLGKG